MKDSNSNDTQSAIAYRTVTTTGLCSVRDSDGAITFTGDYVSCIKEALLDTVNCSVGSKGLPVRIEIGPMVYELTMRRV
jgi:hypothetical protein